MLTITRDTVVYAMSPDNAPAAHAANGETVRFARPSFVDKIRN